MIRKTSPPQRFADEHAHDQEAEEVPHPEGRTLSKSECGEIFNFIHDAFQIK